jgi:hypothetical protein
MDEFWQGICNLNVGIYNTDGKYNNFHTYILIFNYINNKSEAYCNGMVS